jgi:hypothetical protein
LFFLDNSDNPFNAALRTMARRRKYRSLVNFDGTAMLASRPSYIDEVFVVFFD